MNAYVYTTMKNVNPNIDFTSNISLTCTPNPVKSLNDVLDRSNLDTTKTDVHQN